MDSPLLGKLETIEVFIYYDGPRLYACRNKSDRLFIALWVSESDETDGWLFLPISQRRFMELREGFIDFYTAFMESEDGHVIKLMLNNNQEILDQVFILSKSISPELLPSPGFRLENAGTEDKPSARLPALLETAIASADRNNRLCSNISFDLEGDHGHTAPAEFVGRALLSYQDTIDACAYAQSGGESSRGNIPNSFRRATEMAVTGLFAASFGIQLVAEWPGDLFGNVQLQEGLQAFDDLVAAGADEVRLKELLSKLKHRVVLRYKRFLECLVAWKSGFSIESADPLERWNAHAAMSAGDARAALDAVSRIEIDESRTFRVLGRLVGGNVRTGFFEFLAFDGKKYTGRTQKQSQASLKSAELDSEYNALLLEILQVSPMTEEIHPVYELIELDTIKTQEAE